MGGSRNLSKPWVRRTLEISCKAPRHPCHRGALSASSPRSAAHGLVRPRPWFSNRHHPTFRVKLELQLARRQKSVEHEPKLGAFGRWGGTVQGSGIEVSTGCDRVRGSDSRL